MATVVQPPPEVTSPVPAPALSRERVAQAALRLADAHNLAALSMRRLAEELGVGTMTLYGYFRRKDDLLDAMVDVGMAEIELPERRGSWREQIAAVAGATRRVLVRHPSLVAIRLQQPIVRSEALHTTERSMQILLDAGFGAREAVHAFRILFVYTFGSAAFGLDSPTPEARRRSVAALRALAPDEYPALTALADDVQAVTGHEQFDYGLQRILDGLERRLAELS